MIKKINATSQQKWQPFVPAAHANAQFVFDHSTKATVDTLFMAGAKVGSKIKFAEVFATSSVGMGGMLDHYLTKHILCNETAFLEEEGYWRYEFLFDSAGNNRVDADFMVLDADNLLVRATAVNNSPEKATWTLTFLSATNANSTDASIKRDAIVLANGKGFNVTGIVPLFEAPPMDYGTHPLGLRILWGAKHNAVEYPNGFIPRYQTINVSPGSTQCHWYLLGIGEQKVSDELILRYEEKMDLLKQQSSNTILASTDDPHLPAMNHLAAQIKFNRRYPSRYEAMNSPAFTACPSMDIEYNWDAGYSAMGLVTVDIELAAKCISQYLPGTTDTVLPRVEGAIVPTQILAAWDLFQRSGDKGLLSELLPGLHCLLLICSGKKNDNTDQFINMDPQKDGLICPTGGGTGLDDCPSQVWTRAYEFDWARQENYWPEPIDVNPSAKYLPTKSVNATVFVILSCKILKLMRETLALSLEPLYDVMIKQSEESLLKHCWNESTRHFHWVVADTNEMLPVWDLSGLTPLFSNTWKDYEQRDKMLDSLINTYLTDEGLTTSNPQTEFDRSGYWCGAIWLPLQWNFFKALLGLGQLEHAKSLAKGLLELYNRNHAAVPVCFEKFDAETRTGCGDLWFGALGAPMLSLWSAYYQPGVCTLSYLTLPKSIEVIDDLATAKLELRCDDKSKQAGGLIVLRPDSKYQLTHNDKVTQILSDEYGCIEFSLEGQGANNYLLFEFKISCNISI